MNNDFETYTAAKDAAKANLLKAIKEAIEDPSFDIIGFAALLTQDEDSADWSNPLHSVFDRQLVRKASTYMAATQLLNAALDESAQEQDFNPTDEEVIQPEEV